MNKILISPMGMLARKSVHSNSFIQCTLSFTHFGVSVNTRKHKIGRTARIFGQNIHWTFAVFR